jgi:cell division protein FtsI (penicillin-binding protein 3)
MTKQASQIKRKPRSKNHAKTTQGPRLVQWRFWVVLCSVAFVFVGLAARAAYIQIIDSENLVQQGDNRTLRTRNSTAHRGLILDRNGEQLAVSIPVQAVWADPKIIHDKNGLEDKRKWKAMANVLDLDYQELLARVSDPARRFKYIKRQLSPAMSSYVKNLGIPGVYLRDESKRYYPNGEASAHLVGFTDVEDNGLEGIEKLYNELLKGTPDKRKIRRDAKGRQVELLAQEVGKKSQDLQLTIDQRVQALAYREVKVAAQYYRATSASVVVTNVNTGEILAIVNSPSFNPNNRSNVSPHRFRNRAATDAFEPGSVVKPIAVLSALEFGSAELDTKINTSPGWMRVGGRTVKDSRNLGTLNLEGIIQKSSNMGTAKLAWSMPKEFLLDSFYNFGLVGDSGTNLLGESSGLFRSDNRWSDHEIATLSFGYSIGVTSLQLARMYNTIGNGGINRPLSIIKTEAIPEGERVASKHNVQAVLNMMESVLEDGGSGFRGKVAGYRVGGKTGTSRKAIPGGYGEEYVNIFAGVAPVSDPQLAVVVLINEPQGDLYSGGQTAAPVFGKVMNGALRLLNIAPDDKDVSSLAGIR